jgi:hypothetical protein
MKNISLSQMSSMVFIMLVASFFVSAKEVSSVIPVADVPVKQSINEVVFNTLDLDKDGLLSKDEITSSNNEILLISFEKIDSNADLFVSKQELTDFIDQVKGA